MKQKTDTTVKKVLNCFILVEILCYYMNQSDSCSKHVVNSIPVHKDTLLCLAYGISRIFVKNDVTFYAKFANC